MIVLGALASYAMSRISIPGRDGLLYGLLLLSSIRDGTAAMVPTFQLINQLQLINTHVGVILVLAGGILPTVIFILKDFMDSIPKSYEAIGAAARCGRRLRIRRTSWYRSPVRASDIHRDLDDRGGSGQLPGCRSCCCRSRHAAAAVLMYTFYTERPGRPPFDLGVVLGGVRRPSFSSTSSRRRYGFRFHGSDQILMAAIIATELVSEYPGGVRGVDSVDVEIADGEFFALAGLSGWNTMRPRSIAGLEHHLRQAHDRREGRHERRAGRARRGDGLPGLRPVPAHGRRRQHRLPARGSAGWARPSVAPRPSPSRTGCR